MIKYNASLVSLVWNIKRKAKSNLFNIISIIKETNCETRIINKILVNIGMHLSLMNSLENNLTSTSNYQQLLLPTSRSKNTTCFKDKEGTGKNFFWNIWISKAPAYRTDHKFSDIWRKEFGIYLI